MKYRKTARPSGSNLTPLQSLDDADSPEARCQCGQLVAKLTDDGIELKCKRCKRLVLLPFTSFKNGEVSMNVCSDNEEKEDNSSASSAHQMIMKGTF